MSSRLGAPSMMAVLPLASPEMRQLRNTVSEFFPATRVFISWSLDGPMALAALPDPKAQEVQLAMERPNVFMTKSRYEYWLKREQEAIDMGHDPTPFTLRAANFLFGLFNPKAAIEKLNTIPREKIVADPTLQTAVDRAHEQYRGYKRHKSTVHASLVHSHHVAPPAGPMYANSKDAFADFSSNNKAEMSQVIEKALEPQRQCLGNIIACAPQSPNDTLNAIRDHCASLLGLSPTYMQKYFSTVTNPNDAVKLCIALSSCISHDTTDTKSPKRRREEIERAVENAHGSFAAMNSLVDAMKRDIAAVTAVDVVNAIKSMHRLDAEYVEVSGAVMKTPVGVFRDEVVGSETMLYTAPEQIPSQMLTFAQAFLDAMKDQDTHPLQISAWSHNQIAAIHPFYDGNGRLARMFASVATLVKDDTMIPISTKSGEYGCAVALAHGLNNKNVKSPVPRKLGPLVGVFIKSSKEYMTRLKDAVVTPLSVDTTTSPTTESGEKAKAVGAKVAVEFTENSKFSGVHTRLAGQSKSFTAGIIAKAATVAEHGVETLSTPGQFHSLPHVRSKLNQASSDRRELF